MPVMLFILKMLSRKELYVKMEELKKRLERGDKEALEKYRDLLREIELSEEEGELEYIEEIEVKFDPSKHWKLFSKEITKLLDYLSHREYESISELSRDLNRNVANVYKDLKWLENMGFVALIREGRNVKPRLLVLEYGIRFL